MEYLKPDGRVASALVELARKRGFERRRNRFTLSVNGLTSEVEVQLSAYGPMVFLNVRFAVDEAPNAFLQSRAAGFLGSGDGVGWPDHWNVDAIRDDAQLGDDFARCVDDCLRDAACIIRSTDPMAALAERATSARALVSVDLRERIEGRTPLPTAKSKVVGKTSDPSAQ